MDNMLEIRLFTEASSSFSPLEVHSISDWTGAAGETHLLVAFSFIVAFLAFVLGGMTDRAYSVG